MPDHPTLREIVQRLAPRGEFEVIRRLDGGNRALSVLVRRADGQRFVAKTTGRDEAAVAWAAALQGVAQHCGLLVAPYLRDPAGRFATGGVTLEPHVEGGPAVPGDLARLRSPLARLRAATRDWPQRPGFAAAADFLTCTAGGDIDLDAMPAPVASACRAAWRALAGRPQSAVHGDLNLSNLLIDERGAPVLLDWDESRRDSPLFDFAAVSPALLSPRLVRARLAWEVAAGWQAEPAYARVMARHLLRAPPRDHPAPAPHAAPVDSRRAGR